MKKETEDIELIEAYLDDQLDAASKKIFEERLQKEPKLAADMEGFKAARQAVLNQGLRIKLQQINEEPAIQSGQSIANWKWLTGIAASVLVFIVSYYLIQSSSSNDELFATYYSSYKITNTRGQEGNDRLNNLYLEGHYAEALEIIESTQKKSSHQLIVASNCHIALGNFEEALATLNTILLSADDPLTDHAKWYKGLVLLKLDRTEESMSIFKELSKNSIYSREAKTILEELGT